MDNDLAEGLRHIESSLLYLADRAEELGTTGLHEPSPGAAGWPGRSCRYTVRIRNGRPIIKQLSLDSQGFVLVRNQSAVANFYDEKEVRAVYYPEVERLVKEATGATKVVVFAHDVRSILKARDRERSAQALDTILELMLTRLAILPPIEARLATKAVHSLPTGMQPCRIPCLNGQGFHPCVGDIIERSKPKAFSSQSTQLHRLQTVIWKLTRTGTEFRSWSPFDWHGPNASMLAEFAYSVIRALQLIV